MSKSTLHDKITQLTEEIPAHILGLSQVDSDLDL